MSNSLSYQGGSGSFHGPKKQVIKSATSRRTGDSATTPLSCSYANPPNMVIATDYGVNDRVGFCFYTSESFSANATIENRANSTNKTQLTGSEHYVNFGDRRYSSILPISPCAWSGSGDLGGDDAGHRVTFIYRQGLDGQGR